MSLAELLHNLFFDYTLRTVALGAGLLGLFSGAMGVFAVLRKQSLAGDAVSHAALPGIALAFLLTGSKQPLVLLLGAAGAGWAGMLLVYGLLTATRLNQDTVLGLVLSVFFGFGLVLLTYIQRMPGANKSGLDTYLFGQAAALLPADVWTMAIVSAASFGVLIALWKEVKLVTFDPGLAASIGLPVRKLELLLTGLIVIAIVLGLQTVGVVLMSAMLVAPAVGARQWTDRVSVMVLLAGLFGFTAGVVGAAWSSSISKMPTGPAVVLVATGIALASLFVAPRRGLLWNLVRSRKNRKQLKLDSVLADLYRLAMKHRDPGHGHDVQVLRATNPLPDAVSSSLDELGRKGWATRDDAGLWHLTKEGVEQARLRFDQKEATS